MYCLICNELQKVQKDRYECDRCVSVFCIPCLGKYIDTYRYTLLNPMCPDPWCDRFLDKELVTKCLPTFYDNRVNILDIMSRYKNLSSESNEFKDWVTANAIICPSCNVIIEKTQGCHFLSCKVCGEYFDSNKPKPTRNTYFGHSCLMCFSCHC